MWRYIFWKTFVAALAMFIIMAVFYLSYVSVKPDPYPPFLPKAKDEVDPNLLNKTLYHINDAPILRFGYWLQGIFAHGDFGVMFNLGNNQTIPQKFFRQLPDSMLVTIPSYIFGLVIGVALGIWAGYRRGRLADIIINGFVVIFVAIPSFILAVFAVIIGPLIGLPITFEKNLGLDAMIRTIILPIIVITLISLASWARLMRYEVSNILAMDYILAARTKGFSEMFIFRRYVLKNSLFPFIGSLAVSFTIVFGSSLIIERYFGIGGLATLMLEASKSSEINLLSFNLAFALVLGLGTQIIADVVFFSANPVLKLSFKNSNSPLAKLKFTFLRAKSGGALKEAAND